MNQLLQKDVHHILSRIPKDVVQLLRDDPRLMIGGGIIRAIVAQEKPNDIDFFGSDKDELKRTAEKLVNQRVAKGEASKMHTTDNAITVFSPGRLPVQFITRWVFAEAVQCLESFDFTVCQAVICFDPIDKHFKASCSESFYPDLAARRLVYTSPRREEEPGGSLLRVIKYVRRGYSIQVLSLGAVCSRLFTGIRADSRAMDDEAHRSQVIGGLLRAVDPLLVIDGIEIGEDDHHSPERVA